MKSVGTYKEILTYFFKQGLFCFGGPLAMVSVFQKDLAGPGKWVTHERFSKLIALIKALPGPISTQTGIRLAAIRGGTAAGFFSGILLITPAFFLMILLAHFHPSMQKYTVSRYLLFGMQAASIGVIADGVLRLARPYLKIKLFFLIAFISLFVNYLYPQYEPAVIIGSGILGILIASKSRLLLITITLFLLIIPILAFAGSEQGTINSWILTLPVELQLFFTFFKAGAFTFGTGLAIIPLLSHDVVDIFKWLNPQEFMDALAFGQITPGPVVISSTFIGYKVLGLKGALIATLGIFLPSFFNILVWFPAAEKKLESSSSAKNFVFFAVAAVSGALLMAVIRLLMADITIPVQNPLFENPNIMSRFITCTIAISAFVLAMKNKLDTLLIIPSGGLVALLIFLF